MEPQPPTAGPPGLPRTGIGVDVHAFDPGGRTGLYLAGVYFPDEVAVVGHSDGDVAAHAAADALLVAAGAGDLGSQFGTDDPARAGAAGTTILAEAAGHVRQRGYRVGNIAVQVIGNRPHLVPYRQQAQERLSEAAGAPVTLSATTTDSLGLTGRGEGIAAIATALIVPDGHLT